MKRLVAIESPRSAVAIRVASMNSADSAPVASTTRLRRSPAGKRKSGLRVKAPVIVSCALTIAALLPLRSLARPSGSPPRRCRSDQEIGVA